MSNRMIENLPRSITVFSEQAGGHLQGIAIDKAREYMYFSFTTCLIKADLKGNIIGSVTGLVGHLGCIAYNYEDGRVYGSLEFKHDSIGKGIMKHIGYENDVQDGFYMTCFDVEKINRMNMNAETDGVMRAVFLKEVFDDYSAEGHRFGCSGIDGTTFAPAFDKPNVNIERRAIYLNTCVAVDGTSISTNCETWESSTDIPPPDEICDIPKTAGKSGLATACT